MYKRRHKRNTQTILTLAPKYRATAQLFSFLHDNYYNDLSGRGNHLTLGVAPTPKVSNNGRVLNFNGSSQYLISTKTITHTSPFTVITWVRPAVLNTGYTRILETAYNTGFYLGSSNAGSQYNFIFRDDVNLDSCVGGQQVVNQRDFLAGVYDGVTTRYLYVNGKQVASYNRSSGLVTPVATQLYVSRFFFSGSSYWNGDIGWVGIFSRAFTAAEIWELYNNPYLLFDQNRPSHRIASAAPPPTGVTTYVKVSGAWVPATVYVKNSGVWKPATSSVKVSGVWQ